MKNMGIQFIEDQKLFIIQTAAATYAMAIWQGGIRHIYWGETVEKAADFPAPDGNVNPHFGSMYLNLEQIACEYVGWGGRFYAHPCLKAVFSDTVRDMDLRYSAHRIENNGHTLIITLGDTVYPLSVDLIYTIYDGLDIIDRRSIVRNTGDQMILLENAASATWHMPYGEHYRLTTIGGGYGREYDLFEMPITKAPIVLETRTGLSNTGNLPYFAIDAGDADEQRGRVWFGTLQWAGNWKITVEQDLKRLVRVTGGINDFDFAWELNAGEEFETPVFTGGFTTDGAGGASRLLHEYQRRCLLPKEWADRPLPVLYNAWGAFEFDIDEALLGQLAEKAAAVGIELFVIDDGWFSTRNNARSGLGDWYPSKTKFPNGLNPIIQKVNDLGMLFGIWVEPEMVNPDSDLYRRHPDWVLSFPTRERELSRHQLVLNLAREDVTQYIIGFLDDLLGSHSIAYLKWDMNRFLSQVGWEGQSLTTQKSIWVRYVQNLYRIFEHIHTKYPQVLIENCASGGFRADLSLSRYCSRINRSDNQDPVDALYLHEGFTRLHLSRAAGGGNHISKSGSGVNSRICPMKFKAYVGMLGSLSVGLDLRELTEAEITELSRYIALHKELRPIVQMGDMYRLVSIREQPYTVLEFVSKNKADAVVFIYAPQLSFRHVYPPLRLRGLLPDAVYSVEGQRDMTGNGLGKIGLDSRQYTKGDLDACIIRIHRIK